MTQVQNYLFEYTFFRFEYLCYDRYGEIVLKPLAILCKMYNANLEFHELKEDGHIIKKPVLVWKIKVHTNDLNKILEIQKKEVEI